MIWTILFCQWYPAESLQHIHIVNGSWWRVIFIKLFMHLFIHLFIYMLEHRKKKIKTNLSSFVWVQTLYWICLFLFVSLRFRRISLFFPPTQTDAFSKSLTLSAQVSTCAWILTSCQALWPRVISGVLSVQLQSLLDTWSQGQQLNQNGHKMHSGRSPVILYIYLAYMFSNTLHVWHWFWSANLSILDT